MDLAYAIRKAMIAGVLEGTASAPATLQRYPDITRGEVVAMQQHLISTARQEAEFAGFGALALNFFIPGAGTAFRAIETGRIQPAALAFIGDFLGLPRLPRLRQQRRRVG